MASTPTQRSKARNSRAAAVLPPITLDAETSQALAGLSYNLGLTRADAVRFAIRSTNRTFEVNPHAVPAQLLPRKLAQAPRDTEEPTP